MDISTASIAELRAEYVRLAGVVVEAQNTRKGIEAEINRRLLAVKSAVRINAMPLLEREALKVALEDQVKR